MRVVGRKEPLQMLEPESEGNQTVLSTNHPGSHVCGGLKGQRLKEGTPSAGYSQQGPSVSLSYFLLNHLGFGWLHSKRLINTCRLVILHLFNAFL